MNIGIAFGWLIAIVAACFYLVIAAVIAAFGDRVAALRFSRMAETSEQPGAGTLYLSANALILGRALQGAALVAGTLAMYAGLNDAFSGPAGEAAGLASTGLLAIASATVLQFAAWGVASSYPVSARRLLAPMAGLLHAASGFRWLDWAGRVSRLGQRENGPLPSTPEAEMSQALKENLDLIKEANIPLQGGEMQMIRGILRMDTVKVREIMRPRVDMIVVPVESTPEEMVERMRVAGHSKVPVYEGSLENIVGVVYARDLLASLKDTGDTTTHIRRLAKPPLFVPESQNLDRLLREFQERRSGIAIVVDEYGGVSGLVTVTDLIEDIVGKLEGGTGTPRPGVQQAAASEALVDARLSIDDLNQALGTTIEPQGFDTVGGLVYRELGRVPIKGDTVHVYGLIMTVQSTVGRRVQQVKVIKQTTA